MPGRVRQPLRHVAAGGRWPDGPFVDADGSGLSLVQVEGLALLVRQLQAVWGGRSDRDVALEVGIDPSVVRNLRRGLTVPDLDKVIALAVAARMRLTLVREGHEDPYSARDLAEVERRYRSVAERWQALHDHEQTLRLAEIELARREQDLEHREAALHQRATYLGRHRR